MRRAALAAVAVWLLHGVCALAQTAPAAPAGFWAHPTGRTSMELGWDNPGDSTITKYQYRT